LLTRRPGNPKPVRLPAAAAAEAARLAGGEGVPTARYAQPFEIFLIDGRRALTL
jgi:hypothetical protein